MSDLKIDNLGRLWTRDNYTGPYQLVPDAPRLLNWNRGKCASIHPTVDGLLYHPENNIILDNGGLRFTRTIITERILALSTEGILYELKKYDLSNLTEIAQEVEFISELYYYDKSWLVFSTKEGWYRITTRKGIQPIKGKYIPDIIECHHNILTTADGYYIITYNKHWGLGLTRLDTPENTICVVSYQQYVGVYYALALTSEGEVFRHQYCDDGFEKIDNSLLEIMGSYSRWISLSTQRNSNGSHTSYCEITNENGQKFKITEKGLENTIYNQEILRIYPSPMKNAMTRA